MNCREFHATIIKPIHEATRAERSAMVEHNRSCFACWLWVKLFHRPPKPASREEVFRIYEEDRKDPEADIR